VESRYLEPSGYPSADRAAGFAASYVRSLRGNPKDVTGARA
jgi:hypothetical protein